MRMSWLALLGNLGYDDLGSTSTWKASPFDRNIYAENPDSQATDIMPQKTSVKKKGWKKNNEEGKQPRWQP